LNNLQKQQSSLSNKGCKKRNKRMKVGGYFSVVKDEETALFYRFNCIR